MKNLTHTRVG